MQAQGYSPEDFENEFEVWPENHAAFLLFQRMETQWNWISGLSAARVGLNMSALAVFMARMSLSDTEYNDMLDDIQLMERAALSAMNERV